MGMNNKQTMCTYCNQAFKNCMRFLSHLKSHGVVEDMIADEKKAQQAQTSFNEEDAGNGCPTNVKDPLSNTSYEEKIVLSKAREDEENNQKIECKICSPNKKFSKQWKFDMHLTHYHFREELQNQFGLAEISNNAQVVTCPFCNQTFKACQRFFRHLKTHGVIQKMYENEVQKAPPNSHSIMGNKLIGTKHCNKKVTPQFEQNESKDTHGAVEDVIAGDKAFSCRFCDKFCRTRGKVKQHERVHTGERPYACGYCDATFTQRIAVIVHERIHTGEKPYFCSLCDKKFTTNQNRKKHEKTHNSLTCNFCDKTFENGNQLKLHEGIHTGNKPFSCRFCDKLCRTKGEVKQHERVHTGERPFACGYCYATFTQRISVIVHERIHTGEKPYFCSLCDKKFTTNQNRKKHEKTHNSLTCN